MDLQLKGKRVVITGASMGIGLACATTFAQEGCSVVLAARNEARLKDAAASLSGTGAEVATFRGDLGLAEHRERLAAAFGEADILVNNAGAIPGGGLLDLDMGVWEQAWALKVMGYIHLSQLYLRGMKERGSGVIVNIIGSAGRSPRYDYVCGATGNAALMAFTGAVGGASPAWGVRMFAINPAMTRTDRSVTLSKARAQERYGDESRWPDMLANLPFGRLIEPDEIANAAAFLASPACGYVSGATLDVDGGGAFR
ncbi:short-chain dehydrogenase/reductase [Alsobacter sp. KACC 23698]|uniref:Short-chain dehydrogenase/reductase n=1 Tax=Alsobacter sp. KACC 23698 TaxID=3149229 RepID=A0AAU7JFB0_9HYPH